MEVPQTPLLWRPVPTTTSLPILLSITMDQSPCELFFSYKQKYYPGLHLHSYMSKAPTTASEYDGSGEWFKIKDIGPDFSSGTAVWDLARKLEHLNQLE
jgi:hypothetical protein